MTRKTETATDRIARWNAEPLPFCVTIYNKSAARSRPYGNKRFAAVTDALAWIARSQNPDAYMVDYAGAHEALTPTR